MPLQEIFNAVVGIYNNNSELIGRGFQTGLNTFNSAKLAHTVFKHVKNVRGAASGVVQEVETAAQEAKGLKGFLKANGGAVSKSLTTVGAVWSLFNIYHSVAKEKGPFIEHNRDGGTRLGHKGQRLVGSSLTALPSLAVSGAQLAGLSTATGSELLGWAGVTGTGTIAGAGTIATAGAPIVVAAATWAVNRDVQTAIETTRLYEGVDAAFQHGTHQVRHPETAPLAAKYDNLLPAASEMSKYIKDGNLTHALERGKDGRILHIRDLDLTQGKNRYELRRVFNLAIQADQQVIDKNSSIWPDWLRHGSDIQTQYAAKMDMHMLQSAETELTQLTGEVNAARRAQPPAPRKM